MTDQTTENHTKFHANDPDAEYQTDYRLDGSEKVSEHYKRLSMYNSGIWTRGWADESKRGESDKRYTILTIANQLELTDYQTREAARAFESLDLAELSSPNGIDAYLVAVCVAAHIASEDGRIYHPDRKPENNDELFVGLLQNLSYRPTTVKRCFSKVESRL